MLRVLLGAALFTLYDIFAGAVGWVLSTAAVVIRHWDPIAIQTRKQEINHKMPIFEVSYNLILKHIMPNIELL